MFTRPHHQKIAIVLSKLSPEILKEHECYFADGTAIALKFNEFRESVDIDFMTSNIGCYRNLRNLIRDHNSLAPLLKEGEELELASDIRTDQYGIRTKVLVQGSIIKFEIILEGRIEFEQPDTSSHVLGVSCLTLEDLATSKMLANSDRGLDIGTHTRDIIDLAMMEQPLKTLNRALKKAENAYGSSVLKDIKKVLQRLESKPNLLEENMIKMAIELPQAVIWERLRKLEKLG